MHSRERRARPRGDRLRPTLRGQPHTRALSLGNCVRRRIDPPSNGSARKRDSRRVCVPPVADTPRAIGSHNRGLYGHVDRARPPYGHRARAKPKAGPSVVSGVRPPVRQSRVSQACPLAVGDCDGDLLRSPPVAAPRASAFIAIGPRSSLSQTRGLASAPSTLSGTAPAVHSAHARRSSSYQMEPAPGTSGRVRLCLTTALRPTRRTAPHERQAARAQDRSPDGARTLSSSSAAR